MTASRPNLRQGSIAFTAFLALLVIVAAGTAILYYRSTGSEDELKQLILHTVEKGNFKHIVLEQGDVESSENVEVICQVKSRNREGTAILWVIDEGTRVKKGDKLVELDSSALEQEIKQQRIVVNTSKALKISAKSELDQAEIALEEYLQGQFKQQEQEFLSEILLNEENLNRAEETASFSEELTAQGFQTQTQLKADKFAVEKAKSDLALSRNKLETLRNITKRKETIGFTADIETAKAKYDAEVKSYEEELDKLAELDEQMKLCIITAPEDGQVVHANRFSSRGGSAEFVVEPGSLVRERQEIIRLPNPDKMQVKATINESKVSMVNTGMPAKIQIGAFENDLLDGEVIKVNKYAEPTGWWSSQVKEYGTLIRILNPPEDIRTGMTAEVQIFVEELQDVTQVPVQGILPYRGRHFCLVKNGEALETREVEIGPSDDTVVVINKGLEVNDVIVMNPRHHESLLQLPDIPEPDEPGDAKPPPEADLASANAKGSNQEPDKSTDTNTDTNTDKGASDEGPSNAQAKAEQTASQTDVQSETQQSETQQPPMKNEAASQADGVRATNATSTGGE